MACEWNYHREIGYAFCFRSADGAAISERSLLLYEHVEAFYQANALEKWFSYRSAHKILATKTIMGRIEQTGNADFVAISLNSITTNLSAFSRRRHSMRLQTSPQ